AERQRRPAPQRPGCLDTEPGGNRQARQGGGGDRARNPPGHHGPVRMSQFAQLMRCVSSAISSIQKTRSAVVFWYLARPKLIVLNVGICSAVPLGSMVSTCSAVASASLK